MKRFIDCEIRFRTCNLRCHYCYVTHTRSWGDKLPVFKYSPEHMAKALSADRLGGVSLINLCGEGETLLPPEMTNIIHEILKQGHYVMVVTNGTVTKRFNELAALPADCLARLMFKFSYHYLQLLERNRLDIFFDNVQRMREAGASISLELVPSDEMIPHIEDAVAICKKRTGAVFHVTVTRDETTQRLAHLTKLTPEEYKRIWSQFDSELFRFKSKVFGEKRKEFCYAGDWTATMELVSGELKQCYNERPIQNIYEDLSKPIEWKPVGKHCSLPHCYNAHSFMGLGVIPSVPTPRFAGMRDRVCEDGSTWLKPGFAEFISRKFRDENHELNWLERQKFELERMLGDLNSALNPRGLAGRVKEKIKRRI